MESRVGYPDFILNVTYMNEMYSKVIEKNFKLLTFCCLSVNFLSEKV